MCLDLFLLKKRPILTSKISATQDCSHMGLFINYVTQFWTFSNLLHPPIIVKILNLYIILLCAQLYHWRYLLITCNAFIACYIICDIIFINYLQRCTYHLLIVTFPCIEISLALRSLTLLHCLIFWLYCLEFNIKRLYANYHFLSTKYFSLSHFNYVFSFSFLSLDRSCSNSPSPRLLLHYLLMHNIFTECRHFY